MLFLHRSELFVNPETRLADDLNHVAQVIGRLRFDLLLLRPRHVVRAEQAFHAHRKFDTSRTGLPRAVSSSQPRSTSGAGPDTPDELSPA